jgi:hypothetical protein
MALVVVSLAGLGSLLALVVTDAVVVPCAVGVPETAQEIDAPMASEATGVGGLQTPSVTPGGKPVTLHVTAVAAAVADALLVQSTVPE